MRGIIAELFLSSRVWACDKGNIMSHNFLGHNMSHVLFHKQPCVTEYNETARNGPRSKGFLATNFLRITFNFFYNSLLETLFHDLRFSQSARSAIVWLFCEQYSRTSFDFPIVLCRIEPRKKLNPKERFIFFYYYYLLLIFYRGVWGRLPIRLLNKLLI